MSIKRRVERLEHRLLSEPVVLIMPDGATHELHGPTNFLFRLFDRAICGADLNRAETLQLDLIRRSVHAQEPGNARFVELIRCLLDPAVQEPS